MSKLKRIAVGFCYRSMSPSEFTVRMLKLMAERYEVQAGGIVHVPYRHSLYEARNQVAREFLSTEAEALLMVDTDIAFESDDLLKLADLDVPIVSGVYMDESGTLPVAKNASYGLEQVSFESLPTDPLQVDAVGAGFVLVRREVFETIEKDWFNHLETDGKRLSEDLSFCRRVKKAGFPIWLQPSVVLGHLKLVKLVPGNNKPVESGVLVP